MSFIEDISPCSTTTFKYTDMRHSKNIYEHRKKTSYLQ
ncbi:hypothetical protein C4K34_4467 [Pseudomonas chlororaphis subsp. piscium]|nr:hypothetical protein C4K34_4467 [Pseudomonas chlororaphis subsp. piscium]